MVLVSRCIWGALWIDFAGTLFRNAPATIETSWQIAIAMGVVAGAFGALGYGIYHVVGGLFE